jgi:hypothetical protein
MIALRNSRMHTRHRALPCLLVLAIVACKDGGTAAGSDMGGSVTLTVPENIVVVTGRSSNATISMTRDGRTDAMALSVEGLPRGVTVSLNPPMLTGGTLVSTATFTASVDATTGPASITIKATPNDGGFYPAFTTLHVSSPQITIARNGTGTGTVTSAPAGITCGSACSAPFLTGTTVTLTAAAGANSVFGGWTGGECSGTTTTCTFTATVGATITATFNSTAQGFNVATTAATASVAQGSASTATVSITRVNGYSGAVSFTTTGAPSGLAITAPSNVTGTSAALDIAAAGSVPVGNYPIIISATGAGITDAQTTTLNIQVTRAPGGSGNVSFSFANCDPSGVPIWFAAQSGNGAWTRVVPGSNSTCTFAVAAATGVAWVTQDGPGFATNVIYASGDEITSIALGSQCTGVNPAIGTKSLTGTVTGVGGFATVVIAGALVDHQVIQGPSYTLDGVPSGRRDLIATSYMRNQSGFPSIQKLILRRDVSYATTIPQLSFGSPEAVIPPFVTVTRNNLGADQPSIEVSLITRNGASQTYYSAPGGPNVSAYYGIPDTLLQAGDLHVVTNFAASATGSSFRLTTSVRHSAVPDTVTFGPAPSQPSVTQVGSSPYLRLRTQLPLQSAYNSAVAAEYLQNANAFAVVSTAGYSGTAPANWTVDIPDLTAAGYDATWGLKSGAADWQVTAVGGDVLPLLGAAPFDGARLIGAGVNSPSSAQSQRGRVIRWR